LRNSLHHITESRKQASIAFLFLLRYQRHLGFRVEVLFCLVESSILFGKFGVNEIPCRKPENALQYKSVLEKFLSSVILLGHIIYEHDHLHLTVLSVPTCFRRAHSIPLQEAIMKYNRRQFSRIKFPRPVTLDFGKKKYTCSAINFSLGGVYVQGWFEQQTGDICDIKLSLSENDPEMNIKAVCSVVRQEENGLALRFTSMEPDSFLFLQEALLYKNNAHWCRQPDRRDPPVYSWKII
jgi:hypothetical protein